ncbi:MAG: FAD-dependent oxidoreductase, partial [Deltaproteobacteria bacterium]|nr:FAD-dependent oxidoreductase [Deltaproteobacteria bacterium]
MKPLIRDICSLADRKYDLLVVGGGIFGICAAWDAALRGLSVALIEKKDFSHATSANHLKMVHGGIRYLQHFDIPRIRESSFERSALLRIAPHMVQPLPIVIPTYGYGLKGKWFLGSGMIIYDILTMDRNRALAPERSIPWGKYISRDSVLKLFPGIKKEGLTGAAVFCDGQMYNPPRLAISFLRSAVNKGAVAANYVEAVGFKREKNLINGIEAVDKITGRYFEVHAKCVLNAAGPWSHRFLAKSLGIQIDPPPTFSRDLAFVINRQSTNHHAIAVSTSAQDADSMIDRGGRHLFIAPWRNYTLIGVWHSIFRDSPENITVRKSELEQFVDEVNIAFPGIDLSVNEILTVNTGLTLYGSEAKQGTDKMSFGKRSILIDHSKDHNIEGIITLIGVRATTARGTAQKAINLVMNKLNMPEKDSATESTP